MDATAVVFLGLSAYARSTRAVNLLKLGTFLFADVVAVTILERTRVDLVDDPLLPPRVSGSIAVADIAHGRSELK